MQLSESAKENIKRRTKNKYNLSFALSQNVRKDRTHTLVIRVCVNRGYVDYPTPYTLTKSQYRDKTLAGTRKELRDEILSYLETEMQIVRDRLDKYSVEELHSLDSQDLYRAAFAKEPRRGNSKHKKSEMDMRNIKTSIYWSASSKKYIQSVATKNGYNSVSEFLNEAIFAVMTGAVKAPELNPMRLKAQYTQYLRNPEKYVKILKGEIEKPETPNKKRYKYDLGF